VATAILSHIKVLTHVAELMEHEYLLKSEYYDLFKLIPHATELPTDVQAHIHLKSAEQVIKTHTYQCPCKFCEAWGTLLQKHLDAGHIQLTSCSPPSLASNSSFSSFVSGARLTWVVLVGTEGAVPVLAVGSTAEAAVNWEW